MTSDSDVKPLISRALDQIGALIAAVPPGLADAPTPCEGWDVRALVQHVVGRALRNFVPAARGETANWAAPADELTGDWKAEFTERADALRLAWRDADLGALVSVPGGGEAPLRFRADQQITELTVHSWDLAAAIGHKAVLDPALAEHALEWSRQALRPEYRRAGGFGTEIPVPGDAAVYDRLAGWFGRDPAWTPTWTP